MASLVYNSCLDDVVRGNIDFDTDTFKCLLVDSSYIPDKDSDTRRSDITGEVGNSGSYLAGGGTATVTVSKDIVNDRINISLGPVSFSAATINAAGAVYYKSRGGAASADELVAFIDFGGDVISTNGVWSLTASTLRIQN